MNRREFFASSIGIAGAAVLGGHARDALAAQEEPGPRPKRALMKLGCQRYGSDTKEDIEYYQRHRVEVVNRGIGRQSVAELVKARERLAACGIGIIGRLSTTMDYLKGGQERDAYISTICDEVRRAGEAGITAVLYNFPVPDSPHYTHAIPGRGGASYDAWDLEKARKNPPVSEIGPITTERSWEGITYFLERVVPVADKHRVRLASHPMDPPYPPEGLGGVVRVLGTVDGLKRLVSIVPSNYNGLNFCQGTVCEMLDDPAVQIFDVIRWFGERNKIVNVHFRNIRRLTRISYCEVYPDEGDIDMLKAMRTYRDVGFDGPIMPDHMPAHPDDPYGPPGQQRQAFAYAYGYIRALIQAVDAKEAGA